MEQEVMELRAAASEHKQQMKTKEKLVKENNELKSIISNQDEQVRATYY